MIKMNVEIESHEVLVLDFVKGKYSKYVVALQRTTDNKLIVDVSLVEPDSRSNVLEAIVKDTKKEGEAINDMDLTLYIGTNSKYDKAKITYLSKDENENDIKVEKEYTWEDILSYNKSQI